MPETRSPARTSGVRTEGHGPPGRDQRQVGMYLRFGAMIATAMVVMYGVSYLNTYELDHVRWSEERLFMVLLMGATMALVMLGFMLGMYRNRAFNLAIVAIAIVVFGIGLYPVAVVVVGGVVLWLLQTLTGESVQAPEQIPQDLSPVGTALTIVYAMAIAPFGEELFFRGVLFRALRDRFGFKIGAVGSGVAFGLIHYIPGPAIDAALLMIVMTFVGAAFAFIYERRGAFAAPLAAHVTFNMIGLALILGFR